MNHEHQGTPHMDSQRRALDGIRASLAGGGLTADANGNLVTPRRWTYDDDGHLASVTNATAATDTTVPPRPPPASRR